MRYNPLPKDVYIRNRKKFAAKMLPGSIAVFHSNDIMPTNADGSMGFRQNNDLLYLSGVDQEESVVVLFPDAKDESMREILFIRETSEEIAIWEGAKLTKQEATNASGIATVIWVSDFERMLKVLLSEADSIYVSTNEHTRNTSEVQTRNDRFINWCKATYPAHTYHRAAPIINRLRAVKEPEEITAIQEACNITEKGFRRILQFVKPGVTEYEIEAEHLHEYVRNRSRGFAYGPIIASGFSSCVLHYVENNKACNAGEVLLLDVAAEYGNYASDLTRVIPVSGKFTPRQRDVYNAVLRVQRAAIKMLVPGNTIAKVNADVGLLVQEELIQLGLLTREEVEKQNPAWPAYKKYFMHGTSHFLGLDVHDVGYFNEPILPGMVFTCEPGIYIREESLGIRIENDILVTENGPVDLMPNIPIEADEIEALMTR